MPRVTPKADVFAVGVILFNLLTGRMLFSGRDEREIMFKNKRCILPNNIKHYLHNLSSHVHDLLLKLLKAKPHQRPSAEEALKHHWFEDIREGILMSLELN